MRDQVRQLRAEGVDRDSNHAAMEQLAQDTGGQAFYNTNGLNDALARVVNNGTRYYSLAYVPSNRYDGREIPAHPGKAGQRAKTRLPTAADIMPTTSKPSSPPGKKPDTDPLLMLMAT